MLYSFVIVCLVLSIVYLITQIFVEDIDSRRTIRIEGLLQNGAMGIVVGGQIFSEVIYITPIAIYALIQYIILMFYIGNISIKKTKKKVNLYFKENPKIFYCPVISAYFYCIINSIMFQSV